MVSDGTVCCHDMVRYGYCSHEPLVTTPEPEVAANVEDSDFDGVPTDENGNVLSEAQTNGRSRTRSAADLSQHEAWQANRPQRPSRR